MIPQLYHDFQWWSQKGSVYVISDPHAGDTDMNWRAFYRPEPSSYQEAIDKAREKYEEHVKISDNGDDDFEEKFALSIMIHMLDNINSVAKKNDTLVILGDLGEKYLDFVNNLSTSTVVIINGNHDKKHYDFSEIRGKKITQYTGSLQISDKVMLSHARIPGPWLNIHGHEHYPHGWYGLEIIYKEKYGGNQGFLNVSAELNDFSPINLDKLINSGILKLIESSNRLATNSQLLSKMRACDIIKTRETNKKKVLDFFTRL